MTQPISGTFNVNVPIAQHTPPPIPIVPNQCFLCCRDKGKAWPSTATTVYQGTYLCRECVQKMPDSFLVNEFPPTL